MYSLSTCLPSLDSITPTGRIQTPAIQSRAELDHLQREADKRGREKSYTPPEPPVIRVTCRIILSSSSSSSSSLSHRYQRLLQSPATPLRPRASFRATTSFHKDHLHQGIKPATFPVLTLYLPLFSQLLLSWQQIFHSASHRVLDRIFPSRSKQARPYMRCRRSRPVATVR
ncbi:hypothetical protein PoB_005702500 [Plakobranchus ocellatus]|uniref:Uncharacterized protein n=1 Tax=Plakobranchus ocellatus TaxID=259542 RepID=A0AAV4CCP5_9GAST|nr:hypothetical protein PoB_005702500 [Plakobranchus ocellatus]